MRNAFLFIAFFLFACTAAAQTTSVSGTITDMGGQAWKTGTYSFQFTNSPGNPTGKLFQNGVAIQTPANVNGTLDNTGSFSGVLLADNLTINPSGNTWKMIVCPAATATCYSTNLTITGASQSITAAVIPPAAQVNVNAPPVGYAAYSDAEIVGARQGSFYTNLVDGSIHYCTTIVPCTWVALTSSGSILGTNNTWLGNNTFQAQLNSTGSFSASGSASFSGSGNTGTLGIGATALGAANAWTGNNTHTGVEPFANINNVIYVDGIRYTTIQACVTAAAALSTPGKCFVPTGTANSTQVEMASGVTLEFAPGTFTDTGTSGGVFIHFANTVSNATVKGQGVGTTYLKNNASGTQFGAVIQDEGTDNTISDLTADGNANTTSTIIHIPGVVRPRIHRVKLVADATCVASPPRNYAWDFRSGSELDASDVEAVGGQLDAVQMGAFAAGVTTITGGRVVNLYAHDSCHNGLDIKAQGTSGSVSGMTLSNLRLINNGLASGTAGDTTDDEFGLNLVATLAADGSTITNISISNVVATSNKGSGMRLKGGVEFSVLTGAQSFGNGSGTATDKDAIRLTSGSGSTAPVGNYVQGAARKGSATNALSTDGNTTANILVVSTFNGSGFDPLSLGNANDALQTNTAAGGQLAYGPVIYLGQEAIGGDPTNLPAIYNKNAVGIVLNSGTNVVQTVGPATVLGGHLNQSVVGKYAGTCAMSAGTSCTFTIGASYSTTPICIATPQGTTAIAGACTVSGTTVTVTAASSNSLAWGAILVGNPS